jgi:hypothetical protein
MIAAFETHARLNEITCPALGLTVVSLAARKLQRSLIVF